MAQGVEANVIGQFCKPDAVLEPATDIFRIQTTPPFPSQYTAADDTGSDAYASYMPKHLRKRYQEVISDVHSPSTRKEMAPQLQLSTADQNGNE